MISFNICQHTHTHTHTHAHIHTSITSGTYIETIRNAHTYRHEYGLDWIGRIHAQHMYRGRRINFMEYHILSYKWLHHLALPMAEMLLHAAFYTHTCAYIYECVKDQTPYKFSNSSIHAARSNHFKNKMKTHSFKCLLGVCSFGVSKWLNCYIGLSADIRLPASIKQLYWRDVAQPR